MDLLSTEPAEAAGPRVLRVCEVTQLIRQVLEEQVGQIWVEGEVSNYRKQPSGHQYFTLKDEQCQLQCVLFARQGMWKRSVPLTDGMHVITRGTLTVYEARGQYQLNVQLVQAGGAGLLQAKFEALKKKLDVEGLFDSARKRAIPRFPTAIGIVTSPTGAALRDMLNVLARRAPWLHVIVSPVRVQGDGAADEIAHAVAEFNRFGEFGLRPVDVIVVARGGGSSEDLWQFNEEVVARAIHASEIPVVSGVGHEIDFTIADFVADLRAPTPSAAAELIAPEVTELQRGFAQKLGRIQRCLKTVCGRYRDRLLAIQRAALPREPQRLLQAAAQRLDLVSEVLPRTVRATVEQRAKRLSKLHSVLLQHRPDKSLVIVRQRLESIRSRIASAAKSRMARDRNRLKASMNLLRISSPQATLERGYTITTTTAGGLLRTAKEAKEATRIVTRFSDGTLESHVATDDEIPRSELDAR